MRRDTTLPRSLHYLLAVAEHQSFSRAARALRVSQPTLSQQIKQLEDSLQTQLLDRSARAVRLTGAGEVYLHYARRAVEELSAGKRAIHEVKDLSRGTLRVAVTPVTEYLAVPLLENFSRRYPGISMSVLEMSQDKIEASVIEHGIDIGIVFTNMLSSAASSKEIETYILSVETLNLAVGKTHPYAGREATLGSDAFEREQLVLLNTHFALRRHVDVYCLEHGITPRIAMETNSLSVILEIVRHGRLVTVLPRSIVCAQPGLYPVMVLPELPHHAITLIWHKDTYKSPACLVFAELAKERKSADGRGYPANC